MSGSSLSEAEDVTERSLVDDMIQRDPKERPSAAAVLSHPFFWTLSTMMLFIQVRGHSYGNRKLVPEAFKEMNK